MLCVLNGHQLDAWSKTDSVTACTRIHLVAALLNAKEVTRVVQQHHHLGTALLDAERFFLATFVFVPRQNSPFENERWPQQLPFTTIVCQQHSSKYPRFAAVAGLARVSRTIGACQSE